MSPDPFIEAARMCATPTSWSRIWHDYDLMTVAGVPDAEAYAIAMQVERDRAAEPINQIHRRAA